MKLTYKKYFTTVALIWTGCIILFFFTYMLVLAPQKKSKKQIEKQFAEKKQIYNSALKAAREETRIRLSEQVEYLRSKSRDFVIDFEDSATLTFDISQIARGKKLASFSIENKDKPGSSAIPNCNYISENHIDVRFTAGFNPFAAFLNALERHRPVVFADSFTITRSDQNDSGHQVSMALSIFVRKKPNG